MLTLQILPINMKANYTAKEMALGLTISHYNHKCVTQIYIQQLLISFQFIENLLHFCFMYTINGYFHIYKLAWLVGQPPVAFDYEIQY